MKGIIKKNPLFYAFFLPALVDGLFTLLGQDASYWSNRVVNEASPAYYALLISPLLFVIGSVFWFLLWYWVFKRLKDPINLFLMFLFIAAHSWGSTSWIMKIFKDSGVYTLDDQPSIIFAWSLLLVYFALIAGMATYCLSIYMQKRVQE